MAIPETEPLLKRKRYGLWILSRSGKFTTQLWTLLATLGAFALIALSLDDIKSTRPFLGGHHSHLSSPMNLRKGTSAALGEQKITLSTACSPIEKLSFDPGSWDNVGAKLVTNSMSQDFMFEEALEMTAVKGKC